MPMTVPLVPIGGACVSSIWSSSTRVPGVYWLGGHGGLLVKSLAWKFLLSRPTIAECSVARQIAEQDFPSGLVLITDEAKAQKKTPEGVFLVGRSLVGGGYSLLAFDYLAQRGCL